MNDTVQVAVSEAAITYDKCYTYAVPDSLQASVRPGSMVLVPFGKGNAPRMGVVLAREQTEQLPPKYKTIFDVAPEKAALTPELLKLVDFLKKRTFCSYYEAVKAVIPYGALYKAVKTADGPRLQKQLVRHTQKWYLRTDLEPGNLSCRWNEKQKAVLEKLQQVDAAPEEALLEGCHITPSVLETLCSRGVIRLELRDRTLELYSQPVSSRPICLSAEQQSVADGLTEMLQQGAPQVALLHGVTSSGKTLVFMRLLEKVVLLGKQAIVLVPEISLTPQMIRRIQGRFGDRVAVQHSALNHTERLLQWQQIQNGDVDIVVGTRSAVFAPLPQLGLIIMDEEQEHTYRSENSPRYSAHDVAKFRIVQANALLLFASATPSLESYYAAKNGKYRLFELCHRYGNTPLPQVTMIDTREELAKGNVGQISYPLTDAINDVLSRSKQVILLMNRRGYQTVGICKKCTSVLKCSRCSVPLVYHKSQSKLMCHHCGETVSPPPAACPECGGELRYTGFGTQWIEEELAEKFPAARVLRMDQDTTGKKDSHRQMLADFADRKYDILVGTQMVAKGLDFADVELVGVIGVDTLLLNQSYRAFEQVFALVTQVVGRSGRAGTQGQALIQTVDPSHPILELAAKQDYPSFYQQEIAFRKMNLYPPFCNLCMIGFQADTEAAALAAAGQFSSLLQQQAGRFADIPLRIIGPSAYHVLMVNNKYRYKLTLKCRNDNRFRTLLWQVASEYFKLPVAGRVSLSFDFHSDEV